MKHLALSFPVAGSHTALLQIPQHSLQELDEGLEDNWSQHVILCFDLNFDWRVSGSLAWRIF